MLQFKDLNNWEPMKVQDIIDATPAGAGQLCGFDIQGEGQELIWTCGLPKLSKVATSAFGINLMEPDSNKQGYKKGWCKYSPRPLASWYSTDKSQALHM